MFLWPVQCFVKQVEVGSHDFAVARSVCEVLGALCEAPLRSVGSQAEALERGVDLRLLVRMLLCYLFDGDLAVAVTVESPQHRGARLRI